MADEEPKTPETPVEEVTPAEEVKVTTKTPTAEEENTEIATTETPAQATEEDKPEEAANDVPTETPGEVATTSEDEKTEETPTERPGRGKMLAKTFDIAGWTPRTELGRKVKSGEIKDIDTIIDAGIPILEPEIVDVLLPNLENDLLAIGQSKGKFGGGKRRVFKQTQKKSPEGNKPSFAAMAAIGNKDGYVGLGKGKSKDTVPSREKALRNAKLNILRIQRGCGSWECNCGTPHSVPFKVRGKCGSCIIELRPAPKGKGLVIEPNCAKILQLAGYKDVWSKTFGNTRVTTNLVTACIDALKKLSSTKINPEVQKSLGLCTGKIKTE